MIPQIVYILSLLALGTLALFRPGVSLAAVVVMYALQQLGESAIPFVGNHTWVCNTMIGIIVGIAFCSAAVRGNRPFANYPVNGKVILLFLGYCLLSTAWSISPLVTLKAYALGAPYLVLTILLCPLILTDNRQLGFGLTSSLAFGTIILGSILLFCDFSGRGVQLAGDDQNTGNPLALGSVGAYVAIIAAMQNRPNGGMVWFVTRWAIVVLGLIAIFASGSRGQAIATFLVGLVMLPISRPITSGRGFFGAVAGLVILVAVSGVMIVRHAENDVRWQASNAAENFEASRLEYSAMCLEKWISMPQYWLMGYGSSASQDKSILGSYPHIVPVEVLCEEGFLGLGFFGLIMWLTVNSIARSLRMVKDSPLLRGQLASLGGLYLISFILCLKQGSLMGSPYLFGFAIMVGRFELFVANELQHAPEVQEQYLPHATPEFA